ncbi:MAG: MgtC/SapB family protein [Clostridiales bacterium]|nr:MgtC/SapB family protein [Clostridiales bacterium]
MVFDWITFGEPLSFWQMVLRIVAAVIFGAIIGVEREMKNRPAGMRTHVLVCLGAALIGLVEQQTIAHVVALDSSHINVSVGRLTAQIVSGVGFLGAGTIVMADRRITGLTTAASLWCAACLGLAVGAGFTTMALVACLVVMVVLKLMQQVVHVNTYKRLEVQFIHRNDTLNYIRETFEKMEVKILDQDFHAETTKDGESIYTNVYSLSMRGRAHYQDLITILSEYPNIRTVRTRNV